MNLGEVKPIVDSEVFIAPNASLIGDVKVHPKSSIWYGAVLRADAGEVMIGSGTNIRDRAVVHVSNPGNAHHSSNEEAGVARIGKGVTVGSGAVVGACHVGDGAVIGTGAVVKDGAKVGKDAMISAGSVVESGSTVGAGELWEGAPAKMARMLEPAELAACKKEAEDYVELAAAHSQECGKTHQQIEAEKLKRELLEPRDEDFHSHHGLLGREEEMVDRQVEFIMQDRKKQASAGST